MTSRRAAAATLAALPAAVCVGLGTGTAAALPDSAPEASATPSPNPGNANCTVQVAPPPPVDSSERPHAGSLAPAPLPVPPQPVGGPAMGSCGTVVPPGTPPLPAGVTSASWILADLDSGAVLAAHNPHARERPASCLKVLTALVALRRLDLDTVVAGTQEDANVPGSRVGIGPGGLYSVRQLLTGLMLNSGNDAANALARQLGGETATLREMSQTAAAMGALDTRPATPSGLDGPGMSSSAYDEALFFRAAMRNPTFAEIMLTRTYNWPGRGDLPGFEISNDNKMLTSYPGTIGGKTGFTDDARHTRIAAAKRNGRRLVVVLMRGEQRPVPMDTQAARLLNWGFALPVNTPAVGTLVDETPAPPTAQRADQLTKQATAGIPSTVTAGTAADREYALGTIGAAVVLGAGLSWWIGRCRPGGRHRGRAVAEEDPPTEPLR